MENGNTVSTLERCEGRLIREHLQLHLETARIAEVCSLEYLRALHRNGFPRRWIGAGKSRSQGARERSPAAAATEVASSEGLRRDIWALL